MTPFYQPLSSPRNIRLLHIEPGSYTCPVQCSLEEVQLDSKPKPQYEALSYTWGAQEPPQDVNFGRVTKPVGPNLFVALRTLRCENRRRKLWVDAICINQDDAEEKNHQIRLMTSIYEKSTHVQIWLGEADESTDQAFHCLGKLLEFFRKLRHPFNLATVRDNDPNLRATRNAVSESYPNLGLLESDWAALNSLLRRPWFSRVWVIQETVYARQATFVCGSHAIAWEDLKDVVEGIACLGLFGYLSMHGIEGLGTNITRLVNRMRLNVASPAHSNFYEIITLTRQTLATDPRDKIFALVGLARDLVDHDRLITPNYKKNDPVVVYTDVVMYYLGRPEFFRVLQLIPDTPPINPVENLPSWVPDFSQTTTRLPFEADIYRIASHTDARPRVSNNKKELFLFGRVLDTVAEICPSDSDIRRGMTWNSPESRKHSQISQMAIWYQWCFHLATTLHQSESAYGSHADFHEAFWRTLLCDRDDQALKPTMIYESYFNAFHHCWSRQVEAILTPHSVSNEILSHSTFFETPFLNWAGLRRFCTTSGRRMAWVPQTSQLDDVICAFEGAEVPFVMRPRAKGGFQLIGECYIHGLMYGEGMAASASDKVEFTLR